MLLIQTAFDQEFAAVLAAAERTQPIALPSGSSKTPPRLRSATIAGRECFIVMTGIGPRAARAAMSDCLAYCELPELVLSIGLAGALRLDQKCGQRFLIDKVYQANQPDSLQSCLSRLASNLVQSMGVDSLVTIAQPALTAQVKQQLSQQTSAGLCDMETHAVAGQCHQRGLPWIGARVVSDAASDNIPAWLLTLPRLVEQKRWLGLAGRVATHPQDLPRLIRLALRMHRLQTILTQLTIDLVTHVLPA
jgi:nucleoside phosphorylase